MTENKILLRELQKYRDLEKEMKDITLKDLVTIYKDDITHFGEESIGLRMLSAEDFQYYIDLMEEKSRWKYDIDQLDHYKQLEEQLSKHNTSIDDVVQEYLEKGKGKEV